MNEYEKASVNVVYSNLDFRLLSQIRSLFKKTQTEVAIPISKLAKNNDTSRQTVSKVVNKMLQADMLMRMSRGIYRFNPYMYIPYGGDGESLQKEWNEIKIENETD
jgi:predicted regulator of amino acid metabolism with ACT domain